MFDQIARTLETPILIGRIILILAFTTYAACTDELDFRVSYAMWQQASFEARRLDRFE